MTFILPILRIIFAVVGAYVVISRIVPYLREFMLGAIDNKGAVDAFIYLINVFIVIFTGILVVDFLSSLSSVLMPYVRTVNFFFEIFEALFDYIQWILLALIGVYAFRYLRKK
ncbi:hypothetical protein GF386_05715 [Candidatus Pacearchaeota archaeon]|nr:hypothetical protein [Candidatus Pacearchaeota archaeon]MBD3283591.1 hypothetical protein [Candidatus Pacearchaeota archaeon]